MGWLDRIAGLLELDKFSTSLRRGGAPVSVQDACRAGDGFGLGQVAREEGVRVRSLI